MMKSAFDLMQNLKAIETLKASSLSESQKSKILKEMHKKFKDEETFCRVCPDTYEIIENILGESNGSTKKTTKKITKKATEIPQKRAPKRKK